MTAVDHLHPSASQALSLPVAERLKFIDEPAWINYPTASALLTILHDLKVSPRQHRMRNLLIVGDPNNGKTSIIRQFEQREGDCYINDEDEPQLPVVLIESPPTANEKAIYVQILSRLATVFRASESINKLRHQTIHLLQLYGTKILIIDELHAMLTGSPNSVREVMNTLKFIGNECQVPIVGCGIYEAMTIFNTDKQQSTRFELFQLPTWQDIKSFRSLVKTIETRLPLPAPSNLDQPEISKVLHVASDANFGNLLRILKGCAKDAVKSGDSHLTLAHIENRRDLWAQNGVRRIAL